MKKQLKKHLSILSKIGREYGDCPRIENLECNIFVRTKRKQGDNKMQQIILDNCSKLNPL